MTTVSTPGKEKEEGGMIKKRHPIRRNADISPLSVSGIRYTTLVLHYGTVLILRGLLLTERRY
jgi:hypothetical protein